MSDIPPKSDYLNKILDLPTNLRFADADLQDEYEGFMSFAQPGSRLTGYHGYTREEWEMIHEDGVSQDGIIESSSVTLIGDSESEAVRLVWPVRISHLMLIVSVFFMQDTHNNRAQEVVQLHGEIHSNSEMIVNGGNLGVSGSHVRVRSSLPSLIISMSHVYVH